MQGGPQGPYPPQGPPNMQGPPRPMPPQMGGKLHFKFLFKASASSLDPLTFKSNVLES